MTLKFHIWPSKTIGHLFYVYASFRSHQWIYIWVTVRKRSNRVEFDDFLPPVTLKFYRRPWKTIEHIFYTNSSFTHHFIDIGGFRFELESGNAQIGSTFGNIYSKYEIVYWGYHFSFDYVCSSAIMYMCDFWCQNIYQKWSGICIKWYLSHKQATLCCVAEFKQTRGISNIRQTEFESI